MLKGAGANADIKRQGHGAVRKRSSPLIQSSLVQILFLFFIISISAGGH